MASSSSAIGHNKPEMDESLPPAAKRAKPSDDRHDDLDDIIRTFDTASSNGFGFQCSGVNPPGSLVIAFIHVDKINEAEETKTWRDDLQTDKVKVDEWLGHYFIQIDWTLYDRIPEILNYALQKRKLGLHLQSALEVSYKPGETFDPRTAEERYVQQLETMVHSYGINGDWELLRSLSRARDKLFSKWLFQTDAGKQFCAKIRNMLPRSSNDDEEDEKCNFYSWISWDKVARKHRLFQYSPVWWFGALVDPELEEGGVTKQQ